MTTAATTRALKIDRRVLTGRLIFCIGGDSFFLMTLEDDLSRAGQADAEADRNCRLRIQLLRKIYWENRAISIWAKMHRAKSNPFACQSRASCSDMGVNPFAELN